MNLTRPELEAATRKQAIKLGSYLESKRKQRNITQTQFAKMLGVARSTLRNLESGHASASLDTCLAALLMLDLETNALHADAQLQQPLFSVSSKQKIAFFHQLKQQGVSTRMAKNAAWLLAFSAEKRVRILSRAITKWQRTSWNDVLNVVHAIEQQHGRVMLMGGAAMFLYGKPDRALEYDFWVRIADDELVEIITGFGFEIDRNRAGHVVAYDENRRLNFLLSKRIYNQDRQWIEYDAVEAQAQMVKHEAGSLLIPNIEAMIQLKKQGDDLSQKDVAYLQALLDVSGKALD